MSVSARDLATDTFVPMLRSLSKLLDEGAKHATTKSFDVAVLLNARLAPDMFTLQQQVQLACHFARDAEARLLGRDSGPPAFVDETLDALKGHIEATIAALERPVGLEELRLIYEAKMRSFPPRLPAHLLPRYQRCLREADREGLEHQELQIEVIAA